VAAAQQDRCEQGGTRGKLVRGAAEAVEQHGLRGLTVEHVLKASSFSRRTFYQHFRSRDGVLEAVYQGVCCRLVEAVGAAVEAEPDPAKRLEAAIDAYLDFQQEGGRVVLELQAEAMNPASLLWPHRERVIDQLVELTDGQVRQVLELSLDTLVYRALFEGLESSVLHLRTGGPFTPEARARAAAVIKPMFMAVLLSGRSMPQR